jgi:hypothetical protein
MGAKRGIFFSLREEKIVRKRSVQTVWDERSPSRIGEVRDLKLSRGAIEVIYTSILLKNAQQTRRKRRLLN